MMSSIELQKSKSYDLIALIRPSASANEVADVVGIVKSVIEHVGGKIYHTEHAEMPLKFKIKEFQAATFVVISFTGNTVIPKLIQDKLRYNTQILRFIVMNFDNTITSRFANTPLESFIHPLNSQLAECMTENDRILPFKFTKKHVKNTQNQRKASSAIKTARVLGLYY